MYPDMGVDIKAFKTKLETDKALQQKVADNLNANPDFLAELGKMQEKSDGKPADPDSLMSKAGRPIVTKLVKDPNLLGDDQYVKSLTRSLQMANGNFSGPFGGIMAMIQPFLSMFGDFGLGMSSGGNFMGMGTFNMQDPFGSLLSMASNGMKGLEDARNWGEMSRLGERYAMADAKAVDRNHDGKISDGMVVDANGKPVMEQKYENGKPAVDENGKPIMQQKYDERMDDRVHLTGANGKDITGFLASGLNIVDEPNGSKQAYLMQGFDARTGQPEHAVLYSLKDDGKIEKAYADTGTPIKEVGTRPDPQLTAQRAPQTPQSDLNHQAPSAGPNINTAALNTAALN